MIMPIFIPSVGGGGSLDGLTLVLIILASTYLIQLFWVIIKLWSDISADAENFEWMMRKYKSKGEFFYCLIPFVPGLVDLAKQFWKIGRKEEEKKYKSAWEK